MRQVQRLCQVCRKKYDKQSLNRIVCNDNILSLDSKKQKCGKACYICNSSQCLEQMEKRKIFNRVYKKNFDIEIYKKIVEEIKFANTTNKQN